MEKAMKVISLTIFLFALVLSSKTFSGDIGSLEGNWYPKGAGSGYIRKIVIPQGSFDFSDVDSEMAKGRVTYVGSCLSCSRKNLKIIGNVDTGIASTSFLKGKTYGEYIELEVKEGDILHLNYRVSKRPKVCVPPYNCIWQKVKSGKLTFERGN
jgi:hypothetical protein